MKRRIHNPLPEYFEKKQGAGTKKFTLRSQSGNQAVYMESVTGELHFYNETQLREHLGVPFFTWVD